MNSLIKFLMENGFNIVEFSKNLIVAKHAKYGDVTINKNRNCYYILDHVNIQYKTNKFTKVRKEIIERILN